MQLLKDDELVPLIRDQGVIRGIDAPGDWYGKDSPIQPSSVDLHIGDIYVPGTEVGQSGGEGDPLADHVLEPGNTAIVVTQETFSLPPSIAGIGFPPTEVSAKGILMTNPGHVDPGFAGP